MEIAALQALIRASRKITKQSDGVTFQLELPTDYAWRRAFEENRDETGRVLKSQMSAAVLSSAITGWEGMTAQHLLQEAPADPLPFSPAARSELLDVRTDIADALMDDIAATIAERNERRTAARRNI